VTLQLQSVVEWTTRGELALAAALPNERPH
jgi:hypothetical protein